MSDADTGPDGPEGVPEEVDRVDRSPTYLSSALALVAATVATAVSPASLPALTGCVTGTALLAVGLAVGRRLLVTLAGTTLVAGVLLGATAGAPVPFTLVGVAAALLAFDLGTTAVSLGEQLGREAATERLELVHAAASTLVGLAFVTAGYAVNEVATGGQPLSAVFGLVLAVLVLLAALRRVDPTA